MKSPNPRNPYLGQFVEAAVEHADALEHELNARWEIWQVIRWDAVHDYWPGLRELIDITVHTLTHGGRLLFAGNGGSAADAQHIAAEYLGVGLPALALTTDTSVLTALANDVDYESVFAAQIETMGAKGDLLTVHSTSGNSPNVLAAVQAAKRLGIATAGLSMGEGGALLPLVDVALAAPTKRTDIAQELHIMAGHVVFRSVCAAMLHDEQEEDNAHD